MPSERNGVLVKRIDQWYCFSFHRPFGITYYPLKVQWLLYVPPVLFCNMIHPSLFTRSKNINVSQLNPLLMKQTALFYGTRQLQVSAYN